MKINLKNFIDENKRAEELRQEAKKITELNNLIASIITNKEYFYSDEEELLKEIGLTFKKNEEYGCNYIRYWNIDKGKYKVKLTQKNIKAVQDYIDKKE